MSRPAFLGDSAVLLPVPDPPAARQLAALIAAAGWPGVEELVVGAESLLVVVDPEVADVDEVRREASRMASARGAAAPDAGAEPPPPRHHELPVAFDGPDLDEVAAAVGDTPAEVAARLAAATLEAAFVGFLPGFAYLRGLPPALAAVPRLEEPRPRVPAGSVAVGGGFAGVYPVASAGGWRLLGRTDAPLLDVTAAPYSRLAAGDTVRLRQVAAVGDLASPARPRLLAAGPRRAVVLEPGSQTTVQDLGRRGVAAQGIPRAGAADARSLQLANSAVGNAASAAALEVTLQGPVLRLEIETAVALAGEAPLRIDGRTMPAGTVQRVPAGAVVGVGPVSRGARAVLAVAGGIETPALFGSRSTDTVSGLGPGALCAGDELALGIPGRPRGRFRVVVPARPALLRVLEGPAATDRAVAGLVATEWVVDARTDRAGVRLRGSGAVRGAVAGVPSHGVVTGAVQLPPGGEPIVLGVDHGTLGGYPVLAGVVTADLPVLGQLRPGDGVRFVLVDLAEARAARETAARALAGAVSDRYPLIGG